MHDRLPRGPARVALALILLLAPACGEEPIVPRDGGGMRDGGVMDASNTACTGPGSCPPGAACLGTQCVRGMGVCRSDDECRNDSYCADGTCVPHGAPGRASSPMCQRPATPAFIAPGEICTWRGPAMTDPLPEYNQVAPTVVAADFGLVPSGPDDPPRPSLVATSRRDRRLGGDSHGVIRLLSGASCELQTTITAHLVSGSASAALGDLDGDGVPEVVALSVPDTRPEVADPNPGGVVAFAWNAAARRFDLRWRSRTAAGMPDTIGHPDRWESPSITDLDDDGRPEVLAGGVVYDGMTGRVIDDHLGALRGDVSLVQLGGFAVTADVDLDERRIPELVTGNAIYRWDLATRRWEPAPYFNATAANTWGNVAVADFGEFPGTMRGQPEIAVVSQGMARVQTVTGQVVFGPVALPGGGRGGPPTAADFDGDGRAEFAAAGQNNYVVFDLDCAATPLPAGCASAGVRWARANDDASSNVTGSSVFDFNGDGRAEVVYADECFARIYDGTTGDVLFSRFRSSGTWFEYPTILDANGDYHADIVVPAEVYTSCTAGAPDPTFPGLRCASNEDCVGAGARCDAGLCRCASDDACCARPGRCREEGFACMAAPMGTAGAGNVCRAIVGAGFGGVQVYSDPRGRWVSSRPIWNEHAYSVTNVEDRGRIPRASMRARNWQTAGLNTFRANTQGRLGPTSAPDLTAGAGQTERCEVTPTENRLTLAAPICNRGSAPVAAGAELGFVASSADGGPPVTACTARTTGRLDPGQCETVRCVWASTQPIFAARVTAVVDPNRRVLQCLSGNDTGDVATAQCPPG